MRTSQLALATLLSLALPTPNQSLLTPHTFHKSLTAPFSTARPLTSLSSSRSQDAPEYPPLSDSSYTQNLSTDQRKENLSVIRQIFRSDLADLQRRRDYAGWVEAKKDMKKRKSDDPWFELNERMKDAIQLDEMDDVDEIQRLMEKVGGPPPGVTPTREYALSSDIYDTGMSLSRAESIVNHEQKKKNAVRWKKMMTERMANEEAEEDEWKNNPFKGEEDAKLRREKSMKKMYASIEETRKKAEEKANDIRKKYEGSMGQGSALDRALEAAKKSAQEDAGASITQKIEASKEASTKSVNVDSNGRPRMPGDPDVTRGEISVPILNTSLVQTDDLSVQVTSDYNSSQSDPPMRKHCFSYKIQITNNSDKDTIQLLSRRFEIQTVGARQKDIVQGKGVTGRQPILKPGEIFEYTSTAPLSVRPIGTTIIAARMKGTYSYVIVDPNKTESDQAKDDENVEAEGVLEAELGTFHFIFPLDQRVKPVTDTDTSDDDDEDEDDQVAMAAPTASPSTTSATPNTLPGDEDMTLGKITPPINDASTTETKGVEVACTTQYREERSDPKLSKYCFSYQIRITNNSKEDIQLLSRRFEIQTIGSLKKDVVEGKGVTGRQPVLKPGESFEYTSTAPLSVSSMEHTSVLARMSGEYGFVTLEDGVAKGQDEEKAVLGVFHFVLPQVA